MAALASPIIALPRSPVDNDTDYLACQESHGCVGAHSREAERQKQLGLLGPSVGNVLWRSRLFRTAGAEDTGDHLVTRSKIVGGNA